MYIVMLILRYILGTEGGDFRDLRLVPIRTQTPRWCHDLPIQPSPLPVSSGHVSIHIPIRSPLLCRRRASRSSTNRSRRRGPERRLRLT
jgi:hypothetical protein